MKKNKQQKGFTLLEMLVVMVILGVLVTVGLRSFTTSQMKARDARRKSDLQQIQTALEMYRTDKGYYPWNDEGQIKPATDSSAIAWGSVFNDPDETATIYLGNLPQDPSGLRYYYQPYAKSGSSWIQATAGTEPQAYRIYAYLENTQDGDRVSGDLPDDPTYCGSDGASMECNYYISTPNLTN